MSKYKVAILGANGGIGQPLSLLFKLESDVISQLNLLDIIDPAGVAEDLSHIPTNCLVKAFKGPDELEGALSGMDLVIICAGEKGVPGLLLINFQEPQELIYLWLILK
ncbi:malate dehydrogenase, glyoxysomal-like [Octopus sinensis]|uniref:Malate dehydrogenase, mitochondrial n=1 Tax=Octopus sinensis TaxID=2607531 RepID=A0A7E6EIC6_9MOLL|nr:malate dehydrogenase, glyoxysomal-like [Octopus sinensis]